ncbi:thiamine-binding protein [Dactylosporangium sp. CA-139114]|uniref:thiamine-binding protein n=1 Tax=Dactylosporangium sp. CA-139114 TaxID=3239931 RepID=UPI003D99F564
MSVLVAFSVTPLGLGEDVGALVAEAVRVVRASGLPNRTDAMFTTVEGSTWEEVMAVVQAAVAVVQAAAPRTSTVIKVDWRDGPVGRLESKVATVEQHLAAG